MGGGMSFDVSAGIPGNNQAVYNNLVITLVKFGTFAAPYCNCFRETYSMVPSQMRVFKENEVLDNSTIHEFTDSIVDKLNKQDVYLRNLADDIREVGHDYENFVKQNDDILMSSFSKIRSRYYGSYFKCFQQYQTSLTLNINSRVPQLNSCYVPTLSSAISALAKELNLKCSAFRRALQVLVNDLARCNSRKSGRDKADCVVNLFINLQGLNEIFDQVSEVISSFTAHTVTSDCVKRVTNNTKSYYYGNLTLYQKCADTK